MFCDIFVKPYIKIPDWSIQSYDYDYVGCLCVVRLNSFIVWEYKKRNTARPVRTQVDAADAQVVARANESRLKIQSSGVCFHCFLTAVSIS